MADNPPDKGAESPTTARAIEFDDDQQETGVIQPDSTTIVDPAPTSPTRAQNRVRFDEEEAPPAKPPRPMSPQQQAITTLIEAFPTIDTKVVKAVLAASGGQVEPAFNALLGMSDPDYQEEAPPPQPPRPTAEQRQLQQDEMYARRLAEQYGSTSRDHAPRTSSLPRASRQAPNEEREYSFFDDELPELRENLKQTFFSTQTKVNQFISGLRQRIDGDEEDGQIVIGRGSTDQRQNFGPSQSEQLYGIQKGAEANRSRRSTDRDRYDDDPQVLTGNFAELELRDNEEETPPRKPNRPQANPNLFKPTPAAPQSGPVDEVDAVQGQMDRQASSTVGSKSKKWQPLTSTAPNPDADDNDPFSLGDSDDDRESKSKDVRAEDTERLKQSASEVVVEEEQEGKLSLGPAERSGSMGTRNKEAEDLMK